MIQRIQSIFLLLASVGFFLQFTFSFASSEEPISKILADKVYNINDHLSLLILVILGGAIAFINIFLFRNRSQQLKMGYLTMLLSIALPCLAFIIFYQDSAAFESDKTIEVGSGLYTPIVSLIFAYLAVRFISKDDKLVKSMDRLR